MNGSIINVENVSKSYGGVHANVDITMQVERGSITGIIGPNGCGKTTLFNSIVGYHPIDNGSIQFNGQEISKLRVGDIARLGMLRTFQQTRIYSKIDCVDNMQISVSHRPDSKSSIFASRKGESGTGPNICLNLWVCIQSETLFLVICHSVSRNCSNWLWL